MKFNYDTVILLYWHETHDSYVTNRLAIPVPRMYEAMCVVIFHTMQKSCNEMTTMNWQIEQVRSSTQKASDYDLFRSVVVINNAQTRHVSSKS